jgi:hypothetical protein
MPTSTVPPSPGFQSRPLDLIEISGGQSWFRLYRSQYPNPLGYGFASSRFSDPATDLQPPDRFGVVYLGSSVKVSFAETILRDRGDGRLNDFAIEWSQLEEWLCARLVISAPLNLVDMRGDGLIRMGIPTDVARARSHELSQKWSRALWAHDQRPDGITYGSRLNGETNVVLYDRALHKLSPAATPRLVDCRVELAGIIRDFGLSIV